jgi:stringent starvation protein B
MIPTISDGNGTSTRGYLIRALHEWCTDNGYTPYISVFVDANVQVPLEYVKNNEIVLNVAYGATTNMRLANDVIEFKARFGGQSRDVYIPVDYVLAIYARENGQGMAFPPPPEPAENADSSRPPAKSAPGLRLATTAEESNLATDALHISPVPTHSKPSPGELPPTDNSPGSGGNAGRPTLKRIK